MSQFILQCLKTYEDFRIIKNDWEKFTTNHFPTNYSRTYPWLAAWWKTYHNKKNVSIFIQRNKEGEITSAAPLYFTWEIFGGMPVRMLHLLGNGVGTDDFLVTRDAKGFVSEVFREIKRMNWHVFMLSRITDELFMDELVRSAEQSGCKCTISDTVDFLIRLPASYADYLQSRTKKFRKNLRQSENRLNKIGQLEFVVLDPRKDAVRVQDAGAEIAATSWQYKEGRSHFNQRHGGTLYSNLAQFEWGAGGEDFNLLLVDGRPVAYLLGCRRGRNYYAIDTAYHEDFRNVSAGRILFGRIIERLINEQQVDVLDFEGAGEYKEDYSNLTTQPKSVTLYNHSSYSSMLNKFRDSRLYVFLKAKTSNRPVPVD